MKSHEIDYRIYGDDIQFIEIDLDPGETVVAEAGTMVYMDQDIAFEVRMGDGASPERGVMDKLFQAGSRISYRRVPLPDAFHQQRACSEQSILCGTVPGHHHSS